jgi:hypothetical protein
MMKKTRFLGTCALFLAVLLQLIDTSSLLAQEKLWGKGTAGNFQVKPFPIAEPFRNTSWNEAYEKEFQERVDWVIRQTARAKGVWRNLFRKRETAYGWAMLSVLGGYEKEGIAFLESEDADAERWHIESQSWKTRIPV